MAGYGSGSYNSGHSGGYRSQNRGNGGKGFSRTGNNADLTPRTHSMLDANTYVDTAEEVIKGLKDGSGLLTTSKIRNLLSMISSLYDEVRRKRAEELDSEEQGRVQYIRLHFAYEAGRDPKVKAFVQAADVMAHIKDIGADKERFLLFCRYMEALVAFHRYYGGKE